MRGQSRLGGLAEAAFAALAFLAPFAAYIATLLPGVGYHGDTIQFQSIGKLLGIAHPPGYPGYALLNHLFTRLPLDGSIAYKANLMSAFFGAGAVFLLYGILRVLTVRAPLALLASLAFAFFEVFWSKAVVAEVYTLNVFYMAGVILLLFLWRERGKDRYYLGACLVYALSFGNHLTMITLLPAFAFFVLATDWRVVLRRRNIALVLLFIALGASQYLYLFIRTSQGTVWLNTQVNSLNSFIHMVTAQSFRGYMFRYGLGETLTTRLPLYLAWVTVVVGWVGWGLAAVGVFSLWRHRRWSALCLLLGLLGNLVYTLPYDDGSGINGEFAIPTYLFLTVFLGMGAQALLRGLAPRGQARQWQWGVAALVMVGLATYGGWQFQRNYQAVDQSWNVGGEVCANEVVATVAPNSIFLAMHFEAGALLYKLHAEERRQGENIFVWGSWIPENVYNYFQGKTPGDRRFPPYPPGFVPFGIRNFYVVSELQAAAQRLRQEDRFTWTEVPLGCSVSGLRFHFRLWQLTPKEDLFPSG